MALWIFIVFLVALAFAIPITMSMVLGAMSPLVLSGSDSIQQLIAIIFSALIPHLFFSSIFDILDRVLMAEGGMPRRLFNFFAYFVGNFAGGLPCAIILTFFLWRYIRIGSYHYRHGRINDNFFLVDMGYR